MLNGLLGSSKSVDLGREIAGIRADLSNVVDRVVRMTEATQQQLMSGASSGASSLSDARDRLAGTAHGLLDRGRDWLGVTEDELSKNVKRARATVERNPMLGIAIAAGIGFLLGLSSRRR
jgi:ElaB/YqjD/DUF883 family membrane-anchored ribosome-binding protein